VAAGAVNETSERGSGAETDAARPVPSGKASVWLVDDSPVQLEIVRRALSPRYHVSAYSGGPAMLEQLATSRAPDVLLLDWEMPEMSGGEICAFVRSTYDHAALPILILTATRSEDAVLEALAVGANDYVAIPFSNTELGARIAALVQVKRLYAKLIEVEHQLRIEAEFRERFMGMLAHDLRQPIATILMANQLIPPQGETAQNCLAMQSRAALRMQRMISELLDFTRHRPQSGLVLRRESADLAAIVQNSVDETRLAHSDCVLELGVEKNCEGSWDRDRLRQVCDNLIGNAIEHSAAGSRIGVQLSSDAEHAVLRVSNPGAPIPAELLETLFQPFRRGPNERHASGSVGLGLHIVHQIVSAHRGTISVQSDAGGTHFVVQLPRALPSHASEEAPVSGYLRTNSGARGG